MKEKKTKNILFYLSYVGVIIVSVLVTLFVVNYLDNKNEQPVNNNVTNNDVIEDTDIIEDTNDSDEDDNYEISESDLDNYELINLTSSEFNKSDTKTGRYYITDLNLTVKVIDGKLDNFYQVSFNSGMYRDIYGSGIDLYRIDNYIVIQHDYITDDSTEILAYNLEGEEVIINNEYGFSLSLMTNVVGSTVPSFWLSYVSGEDYPIASNQNLNSDLVNKYCSGDNTLDIKMQVIAKNGVLYYSIADTICSNLEY